MTDEAQLLQTCWRWVGPDGRSLHCAIYQRAAAGVELRVTSDAGDVVRRQQFSDDDEARQFAERWLATVKVTGAFGES